jgi:protein RecA
MAKRASKKAVLPRKRSKIEGETEPVDGDIYGLESSVDRYSSGCTLFDCALGGGWAAKRIANIVGDESTGKTLLAIEACNNFQRTFPEAELTYIETESAFDRRYAENLGLPIDRIDFPLDIFTVEDVFEFLEKLMTDGKKDVPRLVVIDSLDALSDRGEKDKAIDAASYGTKKATQVSSWFRRQNQMLVQSGITLLVISQVRTNIGATYGSKKTRSGGKALDFYASHVVWLKHMGKIEKTKQGVKRVVGVHTLADVKKNKVGRPHRSCKFPILFEYGVEEVQAGLEWLIEIGRTDEIGMTKEAAGKLAVKLDRLSAEEYAEERGNILKTVRRVWAEIERDFTPMRKKYS